METAAQTSGLFTTYHLAWLAISLLALTANLALDRFGRRPFYAIACVLHAVVAFEAVLRLALDAAGGGFCVHCIWFNVLFAAANWLLLEDRVRSRAADGNGEDRPPKDGG